MCCNNTITVASKGIHSSQLNLEVRKIPPRVVPDQQNESICGLKEP